MELTLEVMVTCGMTVTTIYVHDGCQDNEAKYLKSLAIVTRFLFHTLKPPNAQILGAMSPVQLNCVWWHLYLWVLSMELASPIWHLQFGVTSKSFENLAPLL